MTQKSTNVVSEANLLDLHEGIALCRSSIKKSIRRVENPVVLSVVGSVVADLSEMRHELERVIAGVYGDRE